MNSGAFRHCLAGAVGAHAPNYCLTEFVVIPTVTKGLLWSGVRLFYVRTLFSVRNLSLTAKNVSPFTCSSIVLQTHFKYRPIYPTLIVSQSSLPSRIDYKCVISGLPVIFTMINDLIVQNFGELRTKIIIAIIHINHSGPNFNQVKITDFKSFFKSVILLVTTEWR